MADQRLTEKDLEALTNHILQETGNNKKILAIARKVKSAINSRQDNRKRSRGQRKEKERVNYMPMFRVLPRNLKVNVAATFNLRDTRTRRRDMVVEWIDAERMRKEKAKYVGEDLESESDEDDPDESDGDSSYAPTDDDAPADAPADAPPDEDEDEDEDDDGMSVSSFDSDIPLAELARLAEKQRQAKKAATGVDVNIVPDDGNDDGNDDSDGESDGESYDGSFADSDEEDLPVARRALEFERKNDETAENMHDVLDKTAYRNWPGFWEIAFRSLEVGTRICVKYTHIGEDVHVLGKISMTTPTNFDIEMACAKRAKKNALKELKKMLVLDDQTFTSPLEWAKTFMVDVDTVDVFVRRTGSMEWENVVDMVVKEADEVNETDDESEDDESDDDETDDDE
jgi:hypothetical protein